MTNAHSKVVSVRYMIDNVSVELFQARPLERTGQGGAS